MNFSDTHVTLPSTSCYDYVFSIGDDKVQAIQV